MKPLLLDVCSCAGIGADGYEAAGFEVVCLDNDKAALKRNPHRTILGDALTYLADRGFMRQFSAVHASFPCQGWSATRELAKAQGRGVGRGVDLLTPGLPLLARLNIPWIVENVPRSPVKALPGAVQLCGSSFGLKVQRHRWFAPSPGLVLEGTPCDHGTFDADPVSGKPRPWGVYYSKGDSIPSGGRTCLTDEHAHECMGVTERRVPWRFLCEGLPPVYTEHLGRQLMTALNMTSWRAA